MPSTVENKSKKNHGYEDWEIEGKANTLLEAEMIKKDKPLYKLVLKELKKRKLALNKIV